jgi:hypothetical protein
MKRGRPPGSRKLPDEYYSDLFHLFALRRDEHIPGLLDTGERRWWKQRISKMCHTIIKQGSVRWIDRKTGRTVTTITKVDTLRRAVYRAWDQLKDLKVNYGSSVSTGIDAPATSAFKPANIKLEFAKPRSTGGVPRQTDLWIGKKKVEQLIPES